LAVAVLADPVFDKQDERFAELNGGGNQHPKGLARNEKGAKPLAKESGAGSPQSTSVSIEKYPQLASALRDVGISGELTRLRNSSREGKAILRAAPANESFSAFGFAASRATATSPELSKYRIIHFATHGVMDPEHPELSGIVLSMVDEKGQPVDGYLRLHEIYNLDLPAELVVLSACQTGVGKQVKGEGLIALTRGFMYAGAKSVVASLWKVDDSATAALMGEFYRQMFTNNLKPAAALRAAQREIAKQKIWRSPYYWAGFFLQGDWK
jgi:CHAT domain-containing protein